ncbi:MAG: DUF58 domain-containing protein [Chloroflexi bacterium]|nr:DUF58 domain-containing protein [Chloroflexota bacterium]
MKSYITTKFGFYTVLSAALLLVALATGHTEILLFSVPFFTTILGGLVLAGHLPTIAVQTSLARSRTLEGERVPFSVTVSANPSFFRCDVVPLLTAGLTLPVSEQSRAFPMWTPEPRRLELSLQAERWGAFFIGSVLVRTWSPFELLAWQATFVESHPLRVYPRVQRLRAIPSPWKTSALAGNEVARDGGRGIEFADVREFTAGDEVRHINWRVSARHGSLMVNDRHPERNADVVIFLDTFEDLTGREISSLDVIVHLAADLAQTYLDRRDRVGIIGFGGELRWLEPGLGDRQYLRIVEALLDTRVVLSYAWRDVATIPARALPPSALIIGLTPLLDERSVTALLDLHGRGFQLVIVEVSPLAFLRLPRDEVTALGARLWQLRRRLNADRYLQRGIPFATWTPDRSAQSIAEELRSTQRWLYRVRV